MDTIAGRITQRRKELGMTQNDLAEKLNISSKTLSRWETEKQIPDALTMIEIANVLDMTIAELYGENEKCVTVSCASVTEQKCEVRKDTIKRFWKYIVVGIALIVAAASIMLGVMNWNLGTRVSYTAEDIPMYRLTSYDHSILEWIKACNAGQEEIYLLSRLGKDPETGKLKAYYLIYLPHGYENTKFSVQYRMGLKGKILELDYKNTTKVMDETYYLCYLEVDYNQNDLIYIYTYLDGRRVAYDDRGITMGVNWEKFCLSENH